MPELGTRAQAAVYFAGEQAEWAGGWAARLAGLRTGTGQVWIELLYFAFFHIYVWYILCIENFFSKIMGIQLNTIEFMWACPWRQGRLPRSDGCCSPVPISMNVSMRLPFCVQRFSLQAFAGSIVGSVWFVFGFDLVLVWFEKTNRLVWLSF